MTRGVVGGGLKIVFEISFKGVNGSSSSASSMFLFAGVFLALAGVFAVFLGDRGICLLLLFWR